MSEPKKLTVTLDRATRLILNDGDRIEVFPKGSIVNLPLFEAKALIASEKAHGTTEEELKAQEARD